MGRGTGPGTLGRRAGRHRDTGQDQGAPGHQAGVGPREGASGHRTPGCGWGAPGHGAGVETPGRARGHRDTGPGQGQRGWGRDGTDPDWDRGTGTRIGTRRSRDTGNQDRRDQDRCMEELGQGQGESEWGCGAGTWRGHKHGRRTGTWRNGTGMRRGGTSIRTWMTGAWEEQDQDIGDRESNRRTGTRTGRYKDLARDTGRWSQDRGKGQGTGAGDQDRARSRETRSGNGSTWARAGGWYQDNNRRGLRAGQGWGYWGGDRGLRGLGSGQGHGPVQVQGTAARGSGWEGTRIRSGIWATRNRTGTRDLDSGKRGLGRGQGLVGLGQGHGGTRTTQGLPHSGQRYGTTGTR
ncbi:protein qua-1-like isoform X2 [Falco naumanni]|uniref:protein qua-1-like isoform X1 n=1 Tax=Falco naumanni TaxID=148594 RepID=UPI001ADE3DE9|nr:protein qua-1-like isoform X1 [Falco naumanni]XP_040472827.1 protein qua-1-like isoform X2 [Falco naumanni]